MKDNNSNIPANPENYLPKAGKNRVERDCGVVEAMECDKKPHCNQRGFFIMGMVY
jgi:hypothetical protein